MPPPAYDVGTTPSTIFLAPTSDNRGIPQRKTPHYSPPVAKVNGSLHANGAGPRQIRPLTVNEALQYSPLSSIVPFGPGRCPTSEVSIILTKLHRCNTFTHRRTSWLTAHIFDNCRTRCCKKADRTSEQRAGPERRYIRTSPTNVAGPSTVPRPRPAHRIVSLHNSGRWLLHAELLVAASSKFRLD